MERGCVDAAAEARIAHLFLKSVCERRSGQSVSTIWGNIRDVHCLDAYLLEHGVVGDFTEAFFLAKQSRSINGMPVTRALVEMSAREKHFTFISLFKLLSDNTRAAIRNFTMASKCAVEIRQVLKTRNFKAGLCAGE
jgi:hypothetical protein